MNKRIKELAQEAGKYAAVMTTHAKCDIKIGSTSADTRSVIEMFTEKFAELVIADERKKSDKNDPIKELTVALEIAIARIYDILEMEERQAFKEAQKWLPYLEFVLRRNKRNKVKDEQ